MKVFFNNGTILLLSYHYGLLASFFLSTTEGFGLEGLANRFTLRIPTTPTRTAYELATNLLESIQRRDVESHKLECLVRDIVNHEDNTYDPTEALFGPMYCTVHSFTPGNESAPMPLWEKLSLRQDNLKGQQFSPTMEGGTAINYAEIWGQQLYLQADAEIKLEDQYNTFNAQQLRAVKKKNYWPKKILGEERAAKFNAKRDEFYESIKFENLMKNAMTKIAEAIQLEKRQTEFKEAMGEFALRVVTEVPKAIDQGIKDLLDKKEDSVGLLPSNDMDNVPVESKLWFATEKVNFQTNNNILDKPATPKADDEWISDMFNDDKVDPTEIYGNYDKNNNNKKDGIQDWFESIAPRDRPKMTSRVSKLRADPNKWFKTKIENSQEAVVKALITEPSERITRAFSKGAQKEAEKEKETLLDKKQIESGLLGQMFVNKNKKVSITQNKGKKKELAAGGVMRSAAKSVPQATSSLSSSLNKSIKATKSEATKLKTSKKVDTAVIDKPNAGKGNDWVEAFFNNVNNTPEKFGINTKIKPPVFDVNISRNKKRKKKNTLDSRKENESNDKPTKKVDPDNEWLLSLLKTTDETDEDTYDDEKVITKASTKGKKSKSRSKSSLDDESKKATTASKKSWLESMADDKVNAAAGATTTDNEDWIDVMLSPKPIEDVEIVNPFLRDCPDTYRFTTKQVSITLLGKSLSLPIQGYSYMRVLYADPRLRILISPIGSDTTLIGNWETSGLTVVQVRSDLVPWNPRGILDMR